MRRKISQNTVRVGESGVGLTELVIAVAIIGVAILALWQASVYVLRNANTRQDPQIALYLAQEGIEAVRAMRDESWANNIVPAANDVRYYPVTASGAWVLSGSDPGPIQGRFYRYVVFGAVHRDSNDNVVATGGTLDNRTRRIKVTVEWDERGATSSYALVTNITDFLKN